MPTLLTAVPTVPAATDVGIAGKVPAPRIAAAATAVTALVNLCCIMITFFSVRIGTIIVLFSIHARENVSITYHHKFITLYTQFATHFFKKWCKS